MKTIQQLRADKVTEAVNALPNLTDTQRELVLSISLSYAENHSMRVDDSPACSTNEPNYAGIANHVRSSSK